jgi:hypothetical protein
MSTKETTITTETAEDGTEIVSEINTVLTETAADGTETVAEITTTAGDDPGEVEGHITLTETAPDGTETVTEITTSADGTVTVDDDQSLVEEIIEAVFDTEVGHEVTDTASSGDAELEGALSGSELETGSAAFPIGDEMAAPDASSFDAADTTGLVTPVEAGFGEADPAYAATADADTSEDSSLETEDAEALEQQAHVEAATEAQAAADEFIASGDYEAAAQAREVAETESAEAGTDNMLSAYDSSDLAHAAEKQDDAEHYSQQQAMHAQQGDYEAAREDASNAAYATSDADFAAGGADHTGQSDKEVYEMDWAVHEEKMADYQAHNAVAAAEDGNFEQAEMYAASAVDHQASADHYGDLGEHGGVSAVYDPSSEVASGGTYESSFDASAAVDTGFDSGMDTGVDAGVDTTTDDAY